MANKLTTMQCWLTILLQNKQLYLKSCKCTNQLNKENETIKYLEKIWCETLT